MDDYRQPDTPETANEVEMLLDQQAEQAVPSEASKETSADMKAEPINLEEIVQPEEQPKESEQAELKEQPEELELTELTKEQPEESELTELTKEQPEESEQADLKEKQLDELDAASTEESQEGSMESSMEVEAKPEDEATREAQSSVFGQAVTLDAIHDSVLI